MKVEECPHFLPDSQRLGLGDQIFPICWARLLHGDNAPGVLEIDGSPRINFQEHQRLPVHHWHRTTTPLSATSAHFGWRTMS